MIHSTTSASAPTPPPARLPLGTVRGDPARDAVLVDVTEAAVTRLVQLLGQRPSLMWTFGRASGDGLPPSGPAVAALRRAAVVELRDDPGVRAACTLALSRHDATDLATALITAAGSVGAGRDRGTDPAPSAERTPR